MTATNYLHILEPGRATGQSYAIREDTHYGIAYRRDKSGKFGDAYWIVAAFPPHNAFEHSEIAEISSALRKSPLAR